VIRHVDLKRTSRGTLQDALADFLTGLFPGISVIGGNRPEPCPWRCSFFDAIKDKVLVI
jgi:hypothetical protein